MITYRIGAPAATLLGINIRLDGTITPIVRHRTADGGMIEKPDGRLQAARHVATARFVARVASNHVGVVEVAPPAGLASHARAVFPLGTEKPFLDSELPPSPGSNGAYSVTEDLTFQFAERTLHWQAQHMSGRIALDERSPELNVVLRLPEGNQGSVTFDTRLFADADGTLQSEIAAR